MIKLSGCQEITLSDHDFAILNRIIASLNSEMKEDRCEVEIYLEDDEKDFVKRIFSKMPASE